MVSLGFNIMYNKRNDLLLRSLGKRIRELREEKNLSQRHMADLLNTDQAYLSKVENGIKDPRISWLDALTKEFNISLKELFDFTYE